MMSPGAKLRTPSRRASPRGAWLALLHLAFLGAVALHVSLPFLLPEDARSDFGYFHRSAVEVGRGGDPYSARLHEPERLEAPATVFNLNPPFQTVLMAPLGRLAYGPAMWIWYVLGLAAGVLAGLLLARTLVPDRPLRVWGPAFATAILLFWPSLGNAWLAQFGLVLTLVAALTFWLLERGRMATAGAVLGFAAGLKLFVGLFGVLFLLTRRWRALAGFGAAFVGSVILGGVALGWHTYPRYLELLGGVDWHSWSWNVSVFGTTTRLLGPHAGLPAARGVALVLGAGYALFLVLLFVRGERSDDPHALRLAAGLTFVLMILLSPLGWLYYLPALLPACGVLVASARPGRERVVSVAGVVAFLALCSVPQRPYPGPELSAAGYDAWKAELPLVAMLVLAGAHVWLLLRRSLRSSGTRNAAPTGAGGRP